MRLNWKILLFIFSTLFSSFNLGALVFSFILPHFIALFRLFFLSPLERHSILPELLCSLFLPSFFSSSGYPCCIHNDASSDQKATAPGNALELCLRVIIAGKTGVQFQRLPALKFTYFLIKHFSKMRCRRYCCFLCDCGPAHRSPRWLL